MTLSAQGFRTAFVSLTLVLLLLTAVNLWRFGSSPTDENLFIRPPSPVYLQAGAPGRAVTDGREGAADSQALRPGDFVLSVGGRPVTSVDAYRSALEAAEGAVRLLVMRERPQRVVEVAASSAQVRELPVRDVARAALVVDVTPGGASDRAGLRVGDLILRINGEGFANIFEADAIMRRGRVGHATEYEILRATQTATLRVRLASFGLRLSLIVFSLGGLSFLAFGAFVGLARPRIAAARYHGLTFVLIGYALANLLLRRPFEPGWWANVRDVALVAALLLGVAVSLHSAHYYPRERPSLLARRWVLPIGYGLALASFATIVAIGPGSPLGLILLVNLAYLAAVKYLARRDASPDVRRIMRPALLTAAGVGVLVLAVLLLGPRTGLAPEPAYVGVLLIAVPLVELWTIARYRLLDLDLHVRRHVQYSLASSVWTLLPMVVLVWLLVALPQVPLPIPHVRLSESSLEVMGTPLDDRERTTIEKTALMLIAIALAFGFRAVGRRGQRWLAGKFNRSPHDYRRAAKELSKIVMARPDLEGLSTGLIDAVVKLLQVKRVGAVFFHQDRTFCSPRAHGFTEEDWQRVARAAPDVLEGVRKATAEVNAEYVFPRLRRLLRDVQGDYLFPLRAHDELVGALLIGEKLAEDAFRDEDFEFLAALGTQVAPAIENAFLYNELAQQERLKHELEIARRIQMESLPQFTPSVEGLDIAGVSIPAFEVGGDYFDYLNGRPRRLTVMVGDVSGKGTSAALYMSKLQGIVRSLHAFDVTPHELFVRTNDLLCRDLERRSFVTAIGGFFDTGAREMVLARAGHLPLYYYCATSGQVERILTRGLGLGLSARPIFDQELEERVIRYGPGDVFLFITDGITECLGASGDDFGEERVVALLAQHAKAEAREIRDQVTDAVRSFSATVNQFDDQTVVVVKAT